MNIDELFREVAILAEGEARTTRARIQLRPETVELLRSGGRRARTGLSRPFTIPRFFAGAPARRTSFDLWPPIEHRDEHEARDGNRSGPRIAARNASISASGIIVEPPTVVAIRIRSFSIAVVPRFELLQRTVDGVMRDPLAEREAGVRRIAKMPAETNP